jgi:hypothetical protein
MADSDFLHSSRRENLIEHLFIGEVLRHLWLANTYEVDILRAETDASGYDIVIEVDNISRHIQLKSSSQDAAANNQKVNIALNNKSSGCVIWVIFEPTTMKLGPFLWFGSGPGQPLSDTDISNFRVGKQTRPSADGKKAKRQNIRVIPKGKFEKVPTMAELVKKLFG